MAIPMDEASNDFESMIARAEAAVEALRDTYREQLVEDVASLCALWTRIESEGVDQAKLDELHSIAHNIKGQGGSFGYDLVTDIGASFCDYLRGSPRMAPNELAIVSMHIRVLKNVADNNITGDGGETGARLIEKLRQLTSGAAK
jgi:chemotaxis protein histidine kinase CheA